MRRVDWEGTYSVDIIYHRLRHLQPGKDTCDVMSSADNNVSRQRNIPLKKVFLAGAMVAEGAFRIVTVQARLALLRSTRAAGAAMTAAADATTVVKMAEQRMVEQVAGCPVEPRKLEPFYRILNEPDTCDPSRFNPGRTSLTRG